MRLRTMMQEKHRKKGVLVAMMEDYFEYE